MIKKGFLYLIILFGFPGLGQATTYYVSPNGSDNNNGTILSTPFNTIQKAAGVVNPGDKVYIRDGVYRELSKIALRTMGVSPGVKALLRFCKCARFW